MIHFVRVFSPILAVLLLVVSLHPWWGGRTPRAAHLRGGARAPETLAVQPVLSGEVSAAPAPVLVEPEVAVVWRRAALRAPRPCARLSALRTVFLRP